jgi:hypothetical protein
MSFYDVIIDNTIDINFLLTKTSFAIQMPQDTIYKFDLTSKMPSLLNTELLGSTANALASLIEYDIPDYRCSRMFIYYNERINTSSYNLYNSIKSLLEYGFCSYDDYNYNPELLNTKPDDAIYKSSSSYKYKFDIIKIKKDLQSLFLSIINNEPFIVSINIYENFNETLIKIPTNNEKHIGAITVVVCGFDVFKQIFMIRYLNKYLELPFFYLLNDKYSSDCFIFILRNFNININTTIEPIETINETAKITEETQTKQIIDLRSNFGVLYDQGKIGSCTANALCSIFEYDATNGFKGSRLFLYYNERIFINETEKDEGAFIEDGIKALKIYGLCSEKDWEYKIENVFIKPPKEIYIKAKNNFLIEAININNNLKTIKEWLNKNEPITVGIAIYSNFMSFTATKTGMITKPSKSDTFIGGHAVVICGYDDFKQLFILRNSWGDYWGDNGYFYLPYDYITNTNLCNDLWIIVKSEIKKI